MAEDIADKIISTNKGDDGFGSDHFSLKASSE
jgi:hypothetical protein